MSIAELHSDLAFLDQQMLELDMQALEPMEAPGWWTFAGVVTGVVVGTAAAAGGYMLFVSSLTVLT